MKYILLIFILVSLVECSLMTAIKNATREKISVEIEGLKGQDWDVEILNPGECTKVLIAFGIGLNVSFKTVGDNPTQIGDQEVYNIKGGVIVKNLTQDESAVQEIDENCSQWSEQEIIYPST